MTEVSISCEGIAKTENGLPLRERERFLITIPPDFPFRKPDVATPHTRFAGFPHVQWKRGLCLYQASSEWVSTDGMFGFIDRLHTWLRQGAIGQLDPIGGPIHPPVAYVTGAHRLVIPRVNTPSVSSTAWLGTVKLLVETPRRIDLGEWYPIDAPNPPTGVAAVILLPQSFPFEYPRTFYDLYQELEIHGISLRLLVVTLQLACINNPSDAPLYVVIGTPQRGVAGSGQLRQHLAVWHISPTVVADLRLLLAQHSENERVREIGEEARHRFCAWAASASVEWCQVREDRPEIVVRRDEESPIAWFRNKTVTLWGCGALGSYVAEFLARCGVKKLILRDNGEVVPGLIIRQLFDEDDIGFLKVEALARRLQRLRPNLQIEKHAKNILDEPLGMSDWTDSADLVIDTTASNVVLEKLELLWRSSQAKTVPVVSMVIGSHAKHGFVVMTNQEHSGAPRQACRRARIEVCNDSSLVAYADEFWPLQGRAPIFQPEPGCSDPTFVGSAADVAALAGIMLNLVVHDLAKGDRHAAHAHFVTQPHAVTTSEDRHDAGFSWQPDIVMRDPDTDYEVRLTEFAWREVEGWIERSRRLAGPHVETGGLLFGERDDVAKIVWVDEVSGPPPDSQASPEGFVCGIQGVREIAAEKRRRSRGVIQWAGMWHTHPDSVPLPSSTDMEAMARIVEADETPTPRAVMVIVGEAFSQPVVGAFIFDRSDFTKPHAGVHTRLCEMRKIVCPRKKQNVGLALSGGGSRAIAFHLGCLRALHDRGILDQVDVISSVSGGAVVAGMFAYSKDPFPEFDKKVVELLRSGLQDDIARRAFLSPLAMQSLGTALISGTVAVAADVLRFALSFVSRTLGRSRRGRIGWVDRIQPPFRRWVSRTTAFEATLHDRLFDDKKLLGTRRNNVDVVFNATDLRTGSAFRFGNLETGCWRIGRLKNNDVSVARAVAASAAYPVFFPAIDADYTFVDRQGKLKATRVILADGGVYDNLGITCLEPGKSPQFSTNVFHPQYIICCDAGVGLFSDHVHPYWWGPRMVRSFDSIFRKTQNAAYERLHRYRSAGKLKGFVLSYLGQQDDRLPYSPPDLVRREDVVNYPTNFSPMSVEDIELIARRGEQLMRILLAQYCPDL